jgi:hypothetical protein
MTHDIDHPLRYPSLLAVVRRLASSSLRTRFKPSDVAAEFRSGLRAYRDPKHDPYLQNIATLIALDASLEEPPLCFVMGAHPGPFDEGYDLRRRPWLSVLETLRASRSRLGWHPGYAAAHDETLLSIEKDRIESALGSPVTDARFHYLRWTPDTSWATLAALGVSRDHSVGYADLPGFRCGTSQPFQCFSLAQQRELAIEEWPLIIMDTTLAMLRTEGAYDTGLITDIMHRTRRVDGCLTVLVHNCFTDTTILAALMSVVTGSCLNDHNHVASSPVL